MANSKKAGKTPTHPGTSAGRLMPVLLIAGGILLVAVAYFVIRANNQPRSDFVPQVTGSPAISVEPAQIDMGDVTLGTQVRADFVVKNLGDQPLKFSKAPYIEIVEGC
jgi:hypothetical protein